MFLSCSEESLLEKSDTLNVSGYTLFTAILDRGPNFVTSCFIFFIYLFIYFFASVEDVAILKWSTLEGKCVVCVCVCGAGVLDPY